MSINNIPGSLSQFCNQASQFIKTNVLEKDGYKQINNFVNQTPSKIYADLSETCVTNFYKIYDDKLPPTDPKNAAVILGVCLLSLGTVSLGSRAVSGTLALGAKATSGVANLTSQVANYIDEKTDKLGDKLGSFATRSFDTDLKIGVLAATVTLTGLGGVALAKSTNLANLPFPTFS